MTGNNILDEIEIVVLGENACTDNQIPKRDKFYLIKIGKNKIGVQSPITGQEILIAANLDPSEYILKQKLNEGWINLEPEQIIDLAQPGIERFKSSPKTEILIIVNGREKFISTKELSFSEIVSLAFDNPPTGENICFTATYRKGNSQKPEGTLIEGDSIKIKRGMIFNVTATDKS